MNLLDKLMGGGTVTHEGADSTPINWELPEEVEAREIKEMLLEADAALPGGLPATLEEADKLHEEIGKQLDLLLNSYEFYLTAGLALEQGIETDNLKETIEMNASGFEQIGVTPEITHEAAKGTLDKVKRALKELATKAEEILRKFYYSRFGFQQSYIKTLEDYLVDVQLYDLSKVIVKPKTPTYKFNSFGISVEPNKFVGMSEAARELKFLEQVAAPEVWDKTFVEVLEVLQKESDKPFKEIVKPFKSAMNKLFNSLDWKMNDKGAEFFYGDVFIRVEMGKSGALSVVTAKDGGNTFTEPTSDVDFGMQAKLIEVLIATAKREQARVMKARSNLPVPKKLGELTLEGQFATLARNSVIAHGQLVRASSKIIEGAQKGYWARLRAWRKSVDVMKGHS